MRITLREGRKREIRRMCAAVGLKVVRLKRVAFGPIRLGRLRTGQFRRLSPSEVAALRRLVGLANAETG
jgi:pseudouridine synthase